MPTIKVTFEPTQRNIWYRFALDGEPPASYLTLGSLPKLGWSIRVSNHDRINLAGGGNLRDVPGTAVIRVGSADPEGRESVSLKDGESWDVRGGLLYSEACGDQQPCYEIGLYVSAKVFERIAAAAVAGHPPSLRVTLGQRLMSASCEQVGNAALKARFYDASIIDWDNVAAPWVEIEWCEFLCELAPADENHAPATRQELKDLAAELKRDLVQASLIVTAAIALLIVLN